jgi:phosphate transport system permease protein
MQASSAPESSNTVMRKVLNQLFLVVVIVLSIISIIPLLLIFGHIFHEGFSAIKPDFFVNLPKPVGESGGGIANALVGTVMLVAMASLFALPPGIAVGIYLAETGRGKRATVVRLCMEVLQGVPSIVIGIVAYLWIVKPMGNFSAISGSIALAIMMLPVVVRTTEETLRLIPKSLKDASLALGAPYYLTVLKIVLPAGISGIVTGILLSVARIAGETAPLLFTAFGNPFMNWDVAKPISSLPQIIFNYAISPYDDWHTMAWGASFVLITMVLCLNIISKLIARRWRVQF